MPIVYFVKLLSCIPGNYSTSKSIRIRNYLTKQSIAVSIKLIQSV